MITIIVAVAEDNGIGFGNDLLVHLSGDLQRFKRITMGHCLIMGKKTWESLPRKPLAGRKNIVMTDNPGDSFDGAFAARSVNEALALCDDDKEVFIIGGGSVYRQFMPLSDRLFVTHIHKKFNADVFFPEIKGNEWEVSDSEDHVQEGNEPLRFSYTTYLRKVKKNRFIG